MNTFALARNGYRMVWAPALPPRPSRHRRGLGQGYREFIESPELSLFASGMTAITSGYLAYGLGTANNKWSTLAWVVSAAAAVKALHDLSRVGKP
jgi:hypothetical protein